MSRLKDKVDKNRNECIDDDRALSKRIDGLESKLEKVDFKIDQTKVELETVIDIGDSDYDGILEKLEKLDSKIDDKLPNPVAQSVVLQDGNKRLLYENDSLRADNEKLRVQQGILQRCNGNQAKMICKFRDRDRRVLESCNLGNCVDAVKLLKETNDESC